MMDTRWPTYLGLGMGVLAVVVLAWQASVLVGLRRQVTNLEQRLADLETAERGGSRTQAHTTSAGGGSTSWRIDTATVPAVGMGDEAMAQLDVAVEEAIERRDYERRQEKMERHLETQHDRFERLLGQAVEDQLIPAHLEPDVFALLLDEVEFSMELRADVAEGLLTGEEAKAQWYENHEEADAAMAELLGEEAAAELSQLLKGSGRGN